jgi:hypothetical protein
MIDPDTSPQVLSNVHNSIYAAIENSKKHQWTITNYVILVYAAIFGLSRLAKDLTLNERWVFSLLIVGAGVYGIVLLILIQRNLETYRTQLHAFYENAISPEDRKTYQVGKPYAYPHFWRGGTFLFALIGVVGIAGGLVIYSLIRPIC